MKIWLDDERPAPEGWDRYYTVFGVIAAITTGLVSHVSLDNDLGEYSLTSGEEGWQVLAWLEEQVFTDPTFVPPIVSIHTANPVARHKMEDTLWSIERKIAER